MAQYVVGLGTLKRRLEKLSRLEQRAVLRRALRRAAKMVADAERALTPVVTGFLKSIYRVRALKRSRVRFGYRVRSALTQRQKASGNYRWYGSFVNYGTRFIRDQRFMNKAVDAAAPMALKEVLDAIHAELVSLGH